MARELSILTSQDTFERLHTLADTRGKTLRINPTDLLNLLIDHSAMLEALRHTSGAVTVTEARRRPRLKP